MIFERTQNKNSDIKLGKKDEAPEFDDVSYFMMLFSAGVAVGLFFYGVSEPLWHQQSHWFAEAGFHSQDEIDQWALMLTMYHWGFAGKYSSSSHELHEGITLF